jgi:hypothetical protein
MALFSMNLWQWSGFADEESLILKVSHCLSLGSSGLRIKTWVTVTLK